MDDIASTETRRSTLRRPRLSTSSTATFNLGGEFRCEEPTHNHDDVLLSGSDDEYYDNPDERLRRLEEQALLYLQGRRPLLLSASLRGPFDWESGWKNPWMGRRRTSSKEGAYFAKTQRAPEATTSGASITVRARTASQKRSLVLDLTTQSRLADDLGTAADKLCNEKDPEVRKRMAGTSWLRRRNLKRTRTNDDGAATSPTPVRTISLADHPIATYDQEISIPSRSVSAPPIARSASLSEVDAAAYTTLADDIVAESSITSQPNNNAADDEQSRLSVLDSEEATSNLCEFDCANSLGFVSSNNAAVSIQSKAAGLTEGDSVAAAMPGYDTVLPSKEIDGTKANDSAPLHDACSSAAINLQDQGDDMQQDSESTIIPSIAPATFALGSLEEPATVPSSIDTGANEIRALFVPPDDGGSENSRLATQFQSPWTKSQASAFPDPVVSDNDDRVSPPSVSLSKSKQSPWIRVKQPHSPDIELASKAAHEATEKLSLSASDMAIRSLSQNPWADADSTATSYSIAQLPTSPCSPVRDGFTNPSVERIDLDHDRVHESLLPYLPIPIHTANASPTRFQDADKGIAELWQPTPALSQESPKGSGDTGIKSVGAYGDADKENATHDLVNKRLHADGCDIEPAPAAADDEVQDVMDNLDDFLGLWDMDAELAQVRSTT
ncbi:hypothetical protein SEPCBS57363_003224 [Sporothrix epigloea]|uniref:Protamine P1 n=1 Tax=Sporothrix epigloea TaxID=1892477 RepID=A0ABP0DN23_9PEZI